MTEKITTEVEVLLVEDNPHDAELTMRTLKKNNLANRLVWVKDGEEALNFLFARNEYKDREVLNVPKVILLDLKLPKVGGLEVLEAIRTDKRTKSIPVVILTSSKEEKDVISGYDLGVNSYIVKPVGFDKFTDAIKDVGFYWLLMNQPKR